MIESATRLNPNKESRIKTIEKGLEQYAQQQIKKHCNNCMYSYCSKDVKDHSNIILKNFAATSKYL